MTDRPYLVALVALLASLTGLALPHAPQAQVSPEPAPGPPPGVTQEPPLRALLTFEGRTHEVVIGAPTQLQDGRPLQIALLPARRFQRPGAFSFEYPSDWAFAGNEGLPGPFRGLWSVSRQHAPGKGASLSIHQLGADPPASPDADVAPGTAETPDPGGAPTWILLDGRRLEGRTVSYPTLRLGSLYPRTQWRTRTFTWNDERGDRWQLTLQDEIPLDADPMGAILHQQAGSLWIQDPSIELLTSMQDASEVVFPPDHPLAGILASWTWE